MSWFNKMVLANLVLLALALAGCASKSHTPPVEKQHQEKLSATVNMPFDTAWQALMDYACSSFFVIDTFDKISGVIKLSFGGSQAHEFIDCGTIKEDTPEFKYSGPYTRFLEQYADAKLQGKMTLIVKELGPKKTSIRATGSYTFMANLTEPAAWIFTSDTSSTLTLSAEQSMRDSTQTRSCQSNSRAEKKIIQIINLLK